MSETIMRNQVGQNSLNIKEVYMHETKKEPLLPTHITLLNTIGFGSPIPIKVKVCCRKHSPSERTTEGVQHALFRQKCLKSLEMSITPCSGTKWGLDQPGYKEILLPCEDSQAVEQAAQSLSLEVFKTRLDLQR